MYYEIAGLKVSMNPKYQPLTDQVIPYLVKDIPKIIDCAIPQGEAAISRYQKRNPELSLGDAEYLLYGVYFYDALLDHQGIFPHASCVVYDGFAYLFSAPCGTGKSTHTSLWRKVFPTSFILNDDKPAIRYQEGRMFAYGTPFSGKTNQNVNTKVPIAGIAFIKRGAKNSIRKLLAKETLVLFLEQTLQPYHEQRLDQMTSLLEIIIANIPIYELTCNMEDEAVLTSYKAMKPKS